MSACGAMCTEGEDKEAYLKEAVECLEKIEQELIKGKSKFFGGESIGYLDIAIGWISYWLPVWEEVGSMTIVDPTRFPATAGWTENFCSHPAVKDKLPSRDKMVVYFQCRSKEIGALVASARKEESGETHLGDIVISMSACSAMCTEGEDKEAYLKEAVECLEKIEQELIKGKSKFFGGESIGYLDIAIGWISYWLPVWEEIGSMTIGDPIQFPATAGWIENFRNHSVVKDKLPPRDKMVIYFQSLSKEIVARMASAKG
ncbi:hypothetical protein RHSIM_Rhsim04G0181400 [Rhododendron simsii]|uniref:glutathione transferase n=1 Tax=Rhododendron simsii TaxID=118357 RepID=A0A834GZ95_RHOSS|nr:hypothetical protein RHSIM_Rhsim04G0181400 [Rhododendron simsii]